MYFYVLYVFFLTDLCASNGGGGEIFVRKCLLVLTDPSYQGGEAGPLTKNKPKIIQDDNQNKMILNNIPFSRWRSWAH